MIHKDRSKYSSFFYGIQAILKSFIERVNEVKLQDRKFQKVIYQNYISPMSKEGSEVAFIPDNISNISSGKEIFNQDHSQKMQDYSVSKLIKNPNNIVQHQSGFLIAETNIKNTERHESIEQKLQNEYNQQIDGRISFGKKQTPFQNSNELQKIRNSEIISTNDKYAFKSYTVPNQNHLQHLSQNDNTDLLAKYTDTDVISEKQSIVEQQNDYFHTNQDDSIKKDQQIFQKIRFQDRFTKKIHKQAAQTYPQTQNQTFNVVQVNKYQEKQTEKGWLEHCVQANNKFLITQTNTLFNYNKALLIQIEKVQLRAKIIELQIETNKLKIALRKSPSSKHINFPIDFQLNRSPTPRIPKKIDHDLRNYCNQLQKQLISLRMQHQENQNTLKILDFYEKQFQKKVNFAYIYQQYLLEKGNKTLLKKIPLSNKNMKSKSPVKSKRSNDSKTKNTLNGLKGSTEVIQSEYDKYSYSQNSINSDFFSDQSFTSLANQLRKDQNPKSKRMMLKNKISLTESNNQISQYFHSPRKSKVPLTHHKKLQQPSNKKNNDSQRPEIPLFNSANRQKKYFYYECQMYLKQLEQDYLLGCEEHKRKLLVDDQRGFRQRQILKMKAHQMKNQILDTQVDVTTRQNELKKENSILMRQLKVIEKQLNCKYPNNDQLSSSENSIRRNMKSPSRGKLSLSSYDLMYKQAERKLKSFKSATLLQNVCRQNMAKSSKKTRGQYCSEKYIFLEEKSPRDDKLNQSQRPSLKLIDNQKLNSSRRLKSSQRNSLTRSSSKQNKFLNRFNTGKISTKLKINQSIERKNRQKIQKSPTQQSQKLPSSKIIQGQYYAI